MKTIAIACNTLKDEILWAIKGLKCDYPVIWIESGQHNTPQKLNTGLQKQIDRISNVDNIILLFGSCGNSLYGLRSMQSKLIFPRVDDCISLFLGGNEGKKEWDKKGTSYYLTKGYLENESNIWTDYNHSLNKYGEEKTKKIMQTLLKNYQKLRIIDTGSYNVQELIPETENIASKLELEHEVIKGSLHILLKALQGDWDDDFVILQPGESVDYSHLGLK